MLISNQRPLTNSRLHASGKVAKTLSRESAPKESFFKSQKFEQLTYGAVHVGAGATALGAGLLTTRATSAGLNGVTGALAGALTGAVAGGLTGYGVAFATEKALSLDKDGSSMMKLVTTTGGLATGAVAGALSGFFGAQPLLVAPATVLAGTVSMMGLSAAQRAIT